VTLPRLLVVTTVHHPDDPRIRSKLIPTLAAEWEITYATQSPGPTDRDGVSVVELTGGRLGRLLTAGRLMVQRRWDLVALHDPELLPLGLVRSLLGRPTLFDLHENLVQLPMSREWLPAPLRRPLAWLGALVLRLAERTMTVTLAEAGYRDLFRRSHPVIANDLPAEMPDPVAETQPPFLAYLGDITAPRGARLAVEAAAGAGTRLVMVGRVAPPTLRPELEALARRSGVDLELTGPLPHRAALERIAGARAGLSPLLDTGNYRHSLPTKVPEYLALGIPAVVSDLPGTRDPVEGLDGVLFVPPGDPDAWRAVGRRLGDRTGLREKAAGQADEVRRRFSWDPGVVLSAYRRAGRR
jgi:glycosyltransferase involved in cell wall biosynthesis